MTWTTSRDVRDLLAAAGEFLASRPVEHTVLLTEAAHLVARASVAADQLYGWWQAQDGVVAGAFLQAPRHPPVLSLLTGTAAAELVDVLGDTAAIGVDGRHVDEVVAAWGGAGVHLVPRSRITLCRLAELRTSPAQPGRSRVATEQDRDLLIAWFEALMGDHPGDPSEREYVIDDPLGFGGITLWEVDGTPVAMAGRSRVVAGMTRLGAVHEVERGKGHGQAALVAAAAAAREVAHDVVAFLDACDWGFTPVLDRVMLAAR